MLARRPCSWLSKETTSQQRGLVSTLTRREGRGVVLLSTSLFDCLNCCFCLPVFVCFCFVFVFCFCFLFFVFGFCFWFVVCSPSLCCCASQVLRLSDSQLKSLSVHLQRQPLSRKRTTSRDVERHGLPTGSTPGPAPTRVGAQGNEFIQLEELGQILSRLWHCTLDACRVLRTFRAKEAERQRAAVTTPSPRS